MPNELNDMHLEGVVGGLQKKTSACLATCAAGCAAQCLTTQQAARAAVNRAARQ